MCRFLAVVVFALVCSAGFAQQVTPIATNRFAIVAGYSNDSSHIIMGRAANRRFSFLGLQYDRVLLRRGWGTVAYQAEWRPVVVNIDPEEHDVATVLTPGEPTLVYTASSRPSVCIAGTDTYTPATGIPQTVTYVSTCGHTPTFGQGLSPLGFRMNMMPHRRWQPVVSCSAGILLSTRPIPTEQAGSFNFIFDFGAGVERISDSGRAWRLEYLVQHYSNKDTADLNPGVDNGIFKISYVFGR
jgi:hypothetical protein